MTTYTDPFAAMIAGKMAKDKKCIATANEAVKAQRAEDRNQASIELTATLKRDVASHEGLVVKVNKNPCIHLDGIDSSHLAVYVQMSAVHQPASIHIRSNDLFTVEQLMKLIDATGLSEHNRSVRPVNFPHITISSVDWPEISELMIELANEALDTL